MVITHVRYPRCSPVCSYRGRGIAALSHVVASGSYAYSKMVFWLQEFFFLIISKSFSLLLMNLAIGSLAVGEFSRYSLRS